MAWHTGRMCNLFALLWLSFYFAEEGTNQESTQEQIFENIRLHKEVIQSVKLQPWPIRKKLKLVRQVGIHGFQMGVEWNGGFAQKLGAFVFTPLVRSLKMLRPPILPSLQTSPNTHQMLSQTFRFHSLSPIFRYTLEFLMMFGLCGSCGSLYVLTGQNICGTPRGRAPGALRHVTQHQRLVGEV